MRSSSGDNTIPNQATSIAPQAKAGVRRSESGKGILLMALGMFLFSAVDTGAKFLTEGLHPFQITWTRQLGLFAGAMILISMHGRRVLRTSHPWLQVARGCVAVCSASAYIFAVTHVPLADAIAISFVAPFMVTLMGALILREPVGIRRWVAVLLGFAGTLVILRPGMGVVHPAALLVIVAAFFFAVRQIISRWLADTDTTSTTIVYTAIVGSTLLTIPLPFVWQTPTQQELMALIGIAVIAGFAEVCVIMALQMAMAVVVAPLQYTLMIWGTFYGFMVFGQLPDLWTWIGTAIIVASGVYTLRREYLISKNRLSNE